MLGLDDWIAGFSDGATVALVFLVALLLGLRHATDPDHLAAVTVLVAAGRERSKALAARLGLAWGLGHALTLFIFGLPILLFTAFLPQPVQQGTETAIGAVIVALAIWLLLRWRRGLFHAHLHPHAGEDQRRDPAQRGRPGVRSPWQALAVGAVHGVGGSAGVGVLLLASVQSRALAVLALGVLALFTAVSMTLLSTGFGLTLSSASARRSFHRVAPVLGTASLVFGAWYALGALEIAPYYF